MASLNARRSVSCDRLSDSKFIWSRYTWSSRSLLRTSRSAIQRVWTAVPLRHFLDKLIVYDSEGHTRCIYRNQLTSLAAPLHLRRILKLLAFLRRLCRRWDLGHQTPGRDQDLRHKDLLPFCLSLLCPSCVLFRAGLWLTWSGDRGLDLVWQKPRLLEKPAHHLSCRPPPLFPSPFLPQPSASLVRAFWGGALAYSVRQWGPGPHSGLLRGSGPKPRLLEKPANHPSRRPPPLFPVTLPPR
jgi:hypothetical protein